MKTWGPILGGLLLLALATTFVLLGTSWGRSLGVTLGLRYPHAVKGLYTQAEAAEVCAMYPDAESYATAMQAASPLSAMTRAEWKLVYIAACLEGRAALW